MNILEKLLNIQQELKCNKNQYNSFGGYNYRNCEDILEAVKPLLKENKCVVTLSDEIINVGTHNYVKSTATLKDVEKIGDEISTNALAREAEIQKGMNDSQITGSTSSYARKYALNGLFDIDDTKDSDFTNNKEEEEHKKNNELEEFKKNMTYQNYLKLNDADKKRVEIALCKKTNLPFMSQEEIKQHLTK